MPGTTPGNLCKKKAKQRKPKPKTNQKVVVIILERALRNLFSFFGAAGVGAGAGASAAGGAGVAAGFAVFAGSATMAPFVIAPEIGGGAFCTMCYKFHV